MIKKLNAPLENFYFLKVSFLNIFNKKTAFTLAEILIVLLIIGIVASMTIPSVLQNTQNMEFKVAWKQNYAIFAQATKQLAINNGGTMVGAFNSNNSFRNAYLPYFNYIKTCPKQTPPQSNTCWYSAGLAHELSGDVFTDDYTGKTGMILNNGAMVVIDLESITCEDTYSINDDDCGSIKIDVNGEKGPNTIGKDIFGLLVLRNGNILPRGSQGDDYYNDNDHSCNISAYPNSDGWSCSAELLK